MCSAKHMEKLSVGTEGQGLSVAGRDALNFKLSEINVDTFHLRALAVLKTVKQTKRDAV